LGICDLDTALWWGTLHHAGNTSVIVFVQETFLRVLAVQLAKVGVKCSLE
jgi:hypothetical protein